ncbi:MAG TPA: hypothetical protein VK709_09285 [Candidatus Saccharimonadales bacterium]|nr:hypothetical protein [Candidatus Saccharimonadales bacterium]
MDSGRKALNLRIFAEATLFLFALSFSGCGAVGSNSNSNTTTGGSIPIVSIVMTTPPPTTMNPGATSSIAATVSNDSSNAGVDWSCTPSASCGSFNPAHTASGAATTYTAPSATVSVVITATATSNHSAIVTNNVSIATASTSGTTLAPGQFVFSVRGETSNISVYGISGAFALDQGGNVTGGEQNYVSVGGANSPEPGGDTITGGKLTTSANGAATLTLTTNNSAVGVSGTETFHIALANSKHALIEEFDSSATASGSLDFQTLGPGGLAQINGQFVFYVKGKRGTIEETFGGLLTGDGTGKGNIVVDVNDDGAGEHGGTNVATYTAPDSFGKGTYTTPAGTDFVYYVVNSKVLRITAFDSGWADVGSAYAGVSNVSKATLHQKFIFADSSVFSSGATFAAAGEMTFDGNGNVSGFADVTENGHATAAAFTGTYMMSSNGYGSITINPGNTQDVSALGLYLADPTINFADPNSTTSAGGGLSGLLLDLDTKIVGSGEMIVPGTQTALPSGNFAQQLQATSNNLEVDAVGLVSITGTTLTGTLDINDTLLSTALKIALSATTTSALTADTNNPGRSTVNISIASTPAQTQSFALYQISSTQFLVVELDSSQFGAGILEQQQ